MDLPLTIGAADQVEYELEYAVVGEPRADDNFGHRFRIRFTRH